MNKKTLIKAAVLSLAFAAVVFSAVPALAVDIKALEKIQREGHYHYRTAQKATVYNVKGAFTVLPKNALGSCSHEVAIKAKLLKERLPDQIFIVAVYNTKNNNYETRHTVIVIKDDNEFIIMNNRDRWLDRVDNLDWMYQLNIFSIEGAREFYNK